MNHPLHGIEKPQLFEQVTEFANRYGLTEVLPLLEKGALVAQKPHAWETIEELDENDKEQLRREVTHRWSHPRTLYFLIVLSSIGAAVQGWDQTGKVNTEYFSQPALKVTETLAHKRLRRIQRSQSQLAACLWDSRFGLGVHCCWYL